LNFYHLKVWPGRFLFLTGTMFDFIGYFLPLAELASAPVINK